MAYVHEKNHRLKKNDQWKKVLYRNYFPHFCFSHALLLASPKTVYPALLDHLARRISDNLDGRSPGLWISTNIRLPVKTVAYLDIDYPLTVARAATALS